MIIVEIVIFILSLLCTFFALGAQTVLKYQMFGFIIGGEVNIFIPHWSAWFFLAIIPLVTIALIWQLRE